MLAVAANILPGLSPKHGRHTYLGHVGQRDEVVGRVRMERGVVAEILLAAVSDRSFVMAVEGRDAALNEVGRDAIVRIERQDKFGVGRLDPTIAAGRKTLILLAHNVNLSIPMQLCESPRSLRRVVW